MSAEILRALDAMERRLLERIEAVEARVSDEATSVRIEVRELRGDVAGLAREIIEANDRSVREAEERLRADDRRGATGTDETSGG